MRLLDAPLPYFIVPLQHPGFERPISNRRAWMDTGRLIDYGEARGAFIVRDSLMWLIINKLQYVYNVLIINMLRVY
jgi:hypothetical protein